MNAEQQNDAPDTADTVDIQQDTEQDTEDVVSDDEDTKSLDPTEPELSSPRPPHRIRMPSKVEIVQAVDSVRTESLNVDAVIQKTAATAKTEDLD